AVFTIAVWTIPPAAARRAAARGKDPGPAYQRGVIYTAVVGFAIYVPYVAIVCMRYGGGVSRHESATIGDLRTLVSAESAYSSANGGFYDDPRCLTKPSACIPGYPATAPTFV